MFNVKNFIVMRTICFMITATIITISSIYVYVANYDSDSLFDANIEALAQTEANNSPGRFMTVGCGGYAFHQWETYCCPNSSYSNCPASGGTCYVDPQYIFGCL